MDTATLWQYAPKALVTLLGIALVYGLTEFVGFLKEVAAYAFMGLLNVPRTAAGGAQQGDNFSEVVQCIF